MEFAPELNCNRSCQYSAGRYIRHV